MCNHEYTHENVINTSLETWENGVGKWVEQQSIIKTCDQCGATFNPITGRWEL